MNSNLSIKSNLMIDDKDHEPKHRYLPGDYIGQIYPGKIDSRSIEKELSEQQLIEYKQYLECLICKRPCAGSCQ